MSVKRSKWSLIFDLFNGLWGVVFQTSEWLEDKYSWICVCVCVCTYMYVCEHIYMSHPSYRTGKTSLSLPFLRMAACEYVCLYMLVYSCMCICMCLYVRIGVIICVRIFVLVCVCACKCTCICACKCSYGCIYICLYTCTSLWLRGEITRNITTGYFHRQSTSIL